MARRAAADHVVKRFFVSGLALSVVMLAGGCEAFRGKHAKGPEQDVDTTSTTTSRADGKVRTAFAFPTGDRASSSLLVEKVAPREIRLNKPYEYEIRATNLTDAALIDVVVRERLSDRDTLEITKSEPNFRTEGEWMYFPLGQLGPKEMRTISVSGTAKKEGSVSSVIAADFKPAMKTITEVVNPILKLTKDGPQSADICEGIRYRYVISNVGTGTEHDVVIEEPLPEGLVTSDGLKTVRIVVGEMPQSVSKEFIVRVKPDKAGTYSSAAVAKAPGGSAEVKSPSVTTTVHQPKLDVTIVGPATEYLNKTATYQVTVKNTGSVAAARSALAIDTGGAGALATIRSAGMQKPDKAQGAGDETVAKARPAADRPIAAADNRADEGAIDPLMAVRREGAELGTLAPGEARTFTVTVRPTREGQMSVSAIGLARCVSPVSAVAKTDVKTLAELKMEVTDLDDPVRIGDDVVYRIVVRNVGTGADKNIALTAALPTGLQFVEAEGATEAKPSGQDVTFGSLPSLAAGQQATWRVRARANTPGDVRIEVRLKSDTLKQSAVETEPTKLY
jgi:uncharacterized repeat protein (TIGR01451 family)